MEQSFHANEWRVDPQLNTISGNGQSVRLEPKVMAVLVHLANHAGNVVLKEDLLQAVWPQRFVSDEVLTTAIFELRKALGDKARNPRFIQTIPKRGYCFIAAVRDEAIADKPPSSRTASPPTTAWRPIEIGLAVSAIALLVVTFGIWKIGALHPSSSQSGGAAPTESAASSTSRAEAHAAYLRGREFSNARTEEGFQKAIIQFERAIQLSPYEARAHAGLADVYSLMVSHNYLRPEEGFTKAKVAASQAVQLDEQSAEAHAALGLVKLAYEWDWTGAEEEFQRALALDPAYPAAHIGRSWLLWASGRLEEALVEIRHAQAAEPNALGAHLTAGDILYRLRRYDEAIAAYQTVLTINSEYLLAYKALGHVYQKQEKPQEAEAAYRKAAALTGAASFAELSQSFKLWSKANDSAYLLSKMSFLLKQKYVRPTSIARLCVDLGEYDRAFEWLERACAERDTVLLFLKVEEGWQPLHHDPRFAHLLRRIGLSP